MTRKQLLTALGTVAITGLGFIGYVFIASLAPAANVEAQTTIINLNLINAGGVKRFKTKSKPVIIVQPDQEMLNDLHALEPHVWNSKRPCEFIIDNKAYYIFFGIGTSKYACSLDHHEKGEKNEYLPSHNWLGGFVDACRDNNYDYAGRSIKTMEYTLINFNIEVPNVACPEITKLDDGLIKIIEIRH